jgi:hypothetical protein
MAQPPAGRESTADPFAGLDQCDRPPLSSIVLATRSGGGQLHGWSPGLVLGPIPASRPRDVATAARLLAFAGARYFPSPGSLSAADRRGSVAWLDGSVLNSRSSPRV